MSPQEKTEFEQLKALVNALVRVENVSFIGSLGRRLGIPFKLADATDVDATVPTSGQVLKWNGTQWAPASDNTA